MLRYVLLLNGRVCGEFATLEEALWQAKAAIIADADNDPEVIDRRTGRACMACASKRWRDEIASRLGS